MFWKQMVFCGYPLLFLAGLASMNINGVWGGGSFVLWLVSLNDFYSPPLRKMSIDLTA